MRVVTRLELKYKLDIKQYYQVLHAITPYVREDRYTRLSGHEKGYFVRSLYFDTFGYLAYREKDDGDYGRVKLRIRTYTDQPDESARLSVELKTKSGNAMLKYSTFVTLAEYREFMDSWHWAGASGEVFTEFERLVLLKAFRPKTIVEYRRQGFEAIDGSGLRLTMDHGVRSAAGRCLFQEGLFFKEHSPGTVVFEIKTGQDEPGWLYRLVKKLGLKAVSNSKYAQSIEASGYEVKASGLWLPQADFHSQLSANIAHNA